MDLLLPYINPDHFADGLKKNYGFKERQAWNSRLLLLPDESGAGTLQLFTRSDIHFFRGKWRFSESTTFYSEDPVGKKGLIDFRTNGSDCIQSCAIEGQKKFEFDTTNVDGIRIFIPETFFSVDRKKMHERFDKYFLDNNILKLLREVLAIDPQKTANSILLESKILEFIFYWREFLCNRDIEQYFEGLNSYQASCVAIAKQIVDNNFSADISIRELSRKSGINEYDLKRGFRTVVGLPVRQYIIKRRMEKARETIRSTDLPLHEICRSLGYENQSHFVSLYIRFFGVHPSGDR
ncbi:MAG TPA: AraC family transcriptional regulator [Puia sp.]|nr:AraC family transcriptional regulator [Puia sp.]